MEGAFKLWNVKEQTCTHSFDPRCGWISSLFFVGGADSACIAVAQTGSFIRLRREEGASEFASETIGEAAGVGANDPQSVFSCCGSFLATCKHSGRAAAPTLLMHDLESMTKTQSIVIRDFSAGRIAASPDSKQLVVGDRTGRIRLLFN
jgi:hypothetical protein